MLLIQVLLIQVSTIIIFDNLYVQNQSTTTAQALARTKTRMTTWLNSNFRGRWKEVSGPNVTLASNQWMIVMRIGKQGGNYDYHYWYRTNDGPWANKHGQTPSVLLPASDMPTTNSSSGWTLNGKTGFYNSSIVYAKWENFYKVIKRAMIACENSGRSTLECFPEVRKTSPMPNGGVKDILDYELSRYACYLIVQNGDPRKEVIALGQTYFAIQTYRQEVADRFNQLDEDSRRLVVRGDIKQWNQLLAETARNAGVITAEEFAIFQNAGYMGLYGGMTVDDIHRRKGLAIGQKILDYMGSTELIANLFRISQTEEKLRKDQVSTSDAATAVHYAVGNEVREAIRKIDGTMPEDLPTPEKSIAQLEREQMERLKQKAIDGQLMLDE